MAHVSSRTGSIQRGLLDNLGHHSLLQGAVPGIARCAGTSLPSQWPDSASKCRDFGSKARLFPRRFRRTEQASSPNALTVRIRTSPTLILVSGVRLSSLLSYRANRPIKIFSGYASESRAIPGVENKKKICYFLGLKGK